MSGYSVSRTEKDPAKLATAIQQLYAGRSNANGVVTLAASATSTVVNAPNCSAASAVFLFQTTADAAAALATTYVSPANVLNGQFIITHASNAQSDRTFFFVCVG
jgi:hypothetical protein